jgi:hypothetical protein
MTKILLRAHSFQPHNRVLSNKKENVNLVNYWFAPIAKELFI